MARRVGGVESRRPGGYYWRWCRRVGMPAASASAAVWLAPREPARMNARHTSAPAATISAVRANPAPRPCRSQSAGWALDAPAHRVQHASASRSAPWGQPPDTSTASPLPPHRCEGGTDGGGVGPGA